MGGRLFCAAWSQIFLLRQCSLEPERVVSTCEHPCQGQEEPVPPAVQRVHPAQGRSNYTRRAGIPQPTLSSGSCGSFWKDVSYSEALSVVLAHGTDTHFTAEEASQAQHPTHRGAAHKSPLSNYRNDTSTVSITKAGRKSVWI